MPKSYAESTSTRPPLSGVSSENWAGWATAALTNLVASYLCTISRPEPPLEMKCCTQSTLYDLQGVCFFRLH